MPSTALFTNMTASGVASATDIQDSSPNSKGSQCLTAFAHMATSAISELV